ncbi:MAG: CoA transferase [Hyphomicrobiaceae bacterium]|nr:MAG: CoA transferase [Hyphomicrobiaceae bacterium]
MPIAKGPLEGVRVIELCHVMAGPVCGLMLADMGADVIKVEKVPGGDDVRRSVPPAIGGEAAAFLMVNRNKRGIAVDLKSADGRDLLLRLLGTADVLIENFRKGVLEKLGFGLQDMRRHNRRLVYCSISGFGRTGPMADEGGFDLVAQGMSGLMSITGEAPGRPPVKVGAPVTDITAGILAAMGICAALHRRERTGEGEFVDTSLFEAGIALTYWQSAIAMATGVAPGPMGSAHPLNAPYQAFKTADGWITIGAANQANWLRLVHVIGAPELALDPRFASNADRMGNLKSLETELSQRLAKEPSAHWLESLSRSGVPSGPVLDVAAMHAHAQTEARAMVVETQHAALGAVATLGNPVKFGDATASIGPAPLLGQHTREVMRELGYDEKDIDRLAASDEIIDGAASRKAG